MRSAPTSPCRPRTSGRVTAMTEASPSGPDADAAAPLLELRGLRAAYEKIEVLHGVDLSVPAGTVYAVLGPNGAGKTTMLGVISGLLPATGGSVVLAGRRVNGANP